MIDKSTKTIVCGTNGMHMSKRRDTHSLGWRVATERKKKGMTQKELLDIIKKRHGISMSTPALSQMEIDETKRVHVDYLVAIADALDV